ncbi:MAG TPA: RNA polymerase sigma factor [Thermoanaerobaculia bacterium]
MQIGPPLEDRSRISFLAKGGNLPDSDRPGGPQDDKALLEECRAGNVSAFERLYEIHGARMKSVAANLLGNLADAEDAVQDCFLKVYRGAASFRGTSRLSTWIYRVLVNSCYDMLRKRRRYPLEARAEGETLVSSREPVTPASDYPLRLSLEACVKDLEPRRRAAFLLFEVEGFTHREVGDILGVPEGTSKTLLFEARRELQRRLWKRGVVPGVGV